MSIKQIKTELIQACTHVETTQEKLDIIKDCYKGEDLVILLMGPSFNNHSVEEYRSLLQNKVVFCVKTTFNIVPDLCDFHLWNCCNLPQPKNDTDRIKRIFYPYERHRPFVICSSNFDIDYRIGRNQKKDIFFRIPDEPNNTLMKTKAYDKYLCSNDTPRPCGPGIFHETVIYTAIHTGVKSITTVGFDLCYKDGERHYNNEQFHIPGISPENDYDALLFGMESFYEWISSKGIDFRICSDINPLVGKIPFVDLKDLD